MKTNRLALVLSSLLAMIPACATSGDGAGDAEDGELDTATGKADSPSGADAALILELANDIRLQDHDLDEDVGLSERVAKAIVAYRDGADRESGNRDDNTFDTLEELDAIPYLGPVAMRAMLTYAKANQVPTKLRIDLVARVRRSAEGREETVALETLNEQLARHDLEFPSQLILGARDGRKFQETLADVATAAEKLRIDIELESSWDPSEYAGLCYDGDLKRVPDAVEGLRYSLFSIYMGIQAERHGTRKKFHYSGTDGDNEREWIEAQREQGNEEQMAAWTDFDTSSKDYLMMTDGGQQGDGTELFAVTVPPCE